MLHDVLLARFRRDLEALTSVPAPRLALAVSGGPDSLALLLLAAAAYPGRVEAATVDHGLRPEAGDEAALVARYCAALGVPHEALAVRVVARGDGLQSAARRARYAALGEWMARRDIPALLTAHHADDQAETLLMRLARGSGVAGLAGIRASGPIPGCPGPQRLYRPLLGWRRSELAAIVGDASIVPVDDPSNRAPEHDRTHFRALLAAAPLLAPEQLAASASHLGDCEDALAWAAARQWDARATIAGRTLHIDASGLPRELRRRLVTRAICEARIASGAIAEWRCDGVGRLLDLLDAGRTATLAGIKCSGGATWRFEPAPPRRETSFQAAERR